MMQPAVIQPSWPLNPYFQDNLDQAGVYGLIVNAYVDEDHNSFSAVTTPEDCSMISTDSLFPSNEFVEVPTLDEEMQVILPMVGLEAMLGTLVLPEEDMEIDSQTGLHHLLEAYGEAVEMGERELAGVIVGCINEKVSPVGETIERVAFNLFQSSGNQNDYIKQESRKNYEAAFKAFYEIFPYGRFAHFAANSAILEAILSDAEIVHVVDFDMGEGVQWPPMIEAIGHQGKSLKLTSIKQEQQNCGFEETKKRLLSYARDFGVNLRVEEISIGELKNSGGEREWMAFNCMEGLPHMGKRRNRRQVMEFLRVAKGLLATNKGIVTFGDGEDGERMKNCRGYSSFFDGYLTHYRSVYESMEGNFPMYLTEARIAMESLFVAPYVNCLSWFQKWEESREGSVFHEELGLEGKTLSKRKFNGS